jgi:hypothetical protein
MSSGIITLIVVVGIASAVWAFLFWLSGRLTNWMTRTRHVASAVAVLAIVLGVGLLSVSTVSHYERLPQNLPDYDYEPPPADVPPDMTPPADAPPDMPPPTSAPPRPRLPADAFPAPSFPELPWPPPRPSALIVIPHAVLLPKVDDPRLHDVDEVLQTALRSKGYWQSSYYGVPGGYALVARLERTHVDGSPYAEMSRWDQSQNIRDFSVGEYLRALFTAPRGYYRVIVFVVSNVSFSASGVPITSTGANQMLENGANVLVAELGGWRYTSDYLCTALIYEFEKLEDVRDPLTRRPGRLSANTHLIKSGIAEALQWPLQ